MSSLLISSVQLQHTNCKSNCNLELQLPASQLQLAHFGHLINCNYFVNTHHWFKQKW